MGEKRIAKHHDRDKNSEELPSGGDNRTRERTERRDSNKDEHLSINRLLEYQTDRQTERGTDRYLSYSTC